MTRTGNVLVDAGEELSTEYAELPFRVLPAVARMDMLVPIAFWVTVAITTPLEQTATWNRVSGSSATIA